MIIKDSETTVPKLQGVGVGLRSCHYPFIENQRPNVPWFEILSDNYFAAGGSSLYHLDKISSLYPVTLHGVGMSLGSTDRLNFTYLTKLKALINRVNPLLVSDHLCWTSVQQQHFHELLPLPYTDEAVRHVAQRILDVQDFLGRQIMIENVSSYLAFKQSEMTEWEFLQTVANEANCLILLDINNIYVSAYNNGFAGEDYIAAMSSDRIAQFHLAGYQDHGTYLLDTHGSPVHAPVWQLFKIALEKFGPIPTVIEWDNHIPDFKDLLKEAEFAQLMMDNHANTHKLAETICPCPE